MSASRPPDDTPPQKRCDHKFIDSVECVKCGWTPAPEQIADSGKGMGKTAKDVKPPVAPDDTPTRLRELRTHLLDCLNTDNDGLPTDMTWVFDEACELWEAEVSRLQQENALLRRSLEMLTKQLDEKDERIDELTGLIGEVD